MKKKLLFSLTALFVFFSIAAFPQQLQKSDVSTNNLIRPHKIDPRPVLDRIDEKVRQELGSKVYDLQKNIEGTDETAWTFAVGSVKSWYAVNMTTDQFYSVSSTCRAVGTNCYIFVQNSLWNTKVTQTAVNSVMEAFDSKTSANSTKGIFQTDVEAFGVPPNVDGDNKIIILILDIIDGYNGGGYVAGYFHGHNETTLSYSNKAEVFYLDADPLNLTEAWGIQEGMSTAAHEFQHMIHYNYHQNQTTFFNEGCSMVAEYICGYGTREQSSYTKETNHYLLDWRSTDEVLTDYSRAFRFMFYYYDQFGADAIKYFVQSTFSGINGINDALSKVVPATSVRFPNLFENWLVANIVNNKNVNPLYGYTYPYLAKAAGTVHPNPNIPATAVTVARLGAQYLHFTSGKNLSIRFSAALASNFKIYAVQSGPNNVDVFSVGFGVDYNVPDFGSKYTQVDFVVLNTSQSNDLSFSYTATGEVVQSVMELKYDITEPTGFLGLSAGDTVAVIFDPVIGGKIESIKVALLKSGSLNGGIWKTKTNFTSNSYRTPLGQKMASITANSTTPAASPYPVPYSNWSTIDVSSLNLNSDQSFTVAFRYNATSATENRIMSTTYPGSSPYHSWTYDGENNNWFYYTNQTEDSVRIYLIRAFVKIGTVGNEEEIIEIAPREYSLAQNYPNPFNPSTTIKFAAPQNGNVAIEIFNIVGQKIRTLVDNYYAAGSHEAVWNGLNDNGEKVSSGIYLYRINAGSYIETKKMTLLK